MRNYDREILDTRTLQLAAGILQRRANELAEQHGQRITISLLASSESSPPLFAAHIHDSPYPTGRGLTLDGAVRQMVGRYERNEAS